MSDTPMTSATFKTLRQGLGLSAPWLGAHLGQTETSVWKYERADREHPVSEHAAAALRDLVNDRDNAVESLIDEYRDLEVVPRVRVTERANHTSATAPHPALIGWPDLAVGIVLDRVAEALGRRVEWVDA